MKWARLQKLKLVHVPNEGKRDIGFGRLLKSLGVSKGFHDFILLKKSKNYGGLFLELKRTTGSRVTKEQMGWLHDLRYEGYKAELAFGWEHASKIITDYLNRLD